VLQLSSLSLTGGEGRVRGNDVSRRANPQRPKQRTKKQPTSNTPEALARAATAHDASAGPSGDKVKVPLTLTLSRAQAERLTARAIREGKNLDALVAELLEKAAGAPTIEERATRRLDPSPPLGERAG
jgi:hypothetical protein